MDSLANIAGLARIRPAYEQVASQLKGLIITGELKPGDRLPSEADLIATLGVSRSTVREALRLLSAQGLIRTARGARGGNFVTTLVDEDLVEVFETRLSLLTAHSPERLAQLRQAREILEIPAAGLAAKNRDETDLDSLRRLCDRCVAPTSPDVPDPRVERSRNFHDAVLRAAHNEVLAAIASAVVAADRRNTLVQRRQVTDWDQSHADHRRILAAIESGDARGAQDAMREHLEFISLLSSRLQVPEQG
jgi:GntR family transcriptional repressor for pyruvate dehydrogenase complex